MPPQLFRAWVAIVLLECSSLRARGEILSTVGWLKEAAFPGAEGRAQAGTSVATPRPGLKGSNLAPSPWEQGNREVSIKNSSRGKGDDISPGTRASNEACASDMMALAHRPWVTVYYKDRADYIQPPNRPRFDGELFDSAEEDDTTARSAVAEFNEHYVLSQPLLDAGFSMVGFIRLTRLRSKRVSEKLCMSWCLEIHLRLVQTVGNLLLKPDMNVPSPVVLNSNGRGCYLTCPLNGTCFKRTPKLP